MCHRLAATPTPATAVHAWALESGATHALTLTLGCWPDRSFDPETAFRPHLKKLFRALAHEVHGIPKRHLLRMRLDEMPWFAGVVEMTTRTGALFPHIHGLLAVHPGEEPFVRGFLRNRWGQDAHPALPAHRLAIEPSLPYAPRAVVRRPGLQPTFELSPVVSAGWTDYSLKKSTALDRGVWTTAEILH